MIKAMTLIGQDFIGPIDDLMQRVLNSASDAPTNITVNPAFPLEPGAAPPQGGALVAYFDTPASAMGWKSVLDTSAEAVPGVLATVVAEEHVVGGKDRLYQAGRRAQLDGVVKVVAFLAPTSHVSVEQFGHYWLGSHAALAGQLVPGHFLSGGYVQNHAVDEDQPYAGVAESYWDGLSGLRAWSEWYQGEEADLLRRDEENFLDTRKRVIVVTGERIVAV